jgi:CheY-like chemotaxis protein
MCGCPYVARNPEVAAGEYIMLAVTDTGTGMPPEVLARAFDPFFTTKDVGKGTGLGLSMIHGFAKQSNGHVKIDSEIGRGTAVRLYLPRCVGPAPAAAGTAQPFDENPRRTATILAVEDDPDLRSLAICQLHKLGYQVLAAADGIKARGILESDEPIDLLFTDVIMPGGITGPALAQLAERIRPGLKTLFTSGYTEHSVIDQVELDPNAPILWKPYVMADLARAVSEMLDTACLGEHCGQSPGALAVNEGARL